MNLRPYYHGCMDHLYRGEGQPRGVVDHTLLFGTIARSFESGLSGRRRTREVGWVPNVGSEAEQAGVAIREGRYVAPDVTTIPRWIAKEGPVTSEDYSFGHRSIKRFDITDADSRVAVRLDDRVFYLWGGMPGYRFPDSAVAILALEWLSFLRIFDLTIGFRRADTNKRRQMFRNYVATLRQLGENAVHNWPDYDGIVYESSYKPDRTHEYRELAVMRKYFGERYECAMLRPFNLSDQQINRQGVLLKTMDATYILGSMDALILFKMSANRDVQIIHLREQN